jgi:F0F1-type ATP synthase membrane subunit b/b'
MRNVQKRASEKEQLLHELAEDRDEAARLRGDLQTRLASVEEEIAETVAQSQEKLDSERKEVLLWAEEEAERLLTEAQAEALQIQQRAMAEFHDELLDAILESSGLIIRQTAPQELHDSLVQQLNDRIWEFGRSEEIQQVEAIRRSLGERTPTVFATSAQPLSPDQQRLLLRTFSALADHDVLLEMKTDPALVAGLRVRLGDLVMDNSINAQLAGLREDVSNALKERVPGG